ncbi:MAG: DNA topoisomerase VI subunit B [Planctomycetota bacterium]
MARIIFRASFIVTRKTRKEPGRKPPKAAAKRVAARDVKRAQRRAQARVPAAPPLARAAVVPAPAAEAPRAARRRATAESMAQSQREISVSEFFTKNRHLLGFDNPLKALLTTVKEAVDNSLDACEEAGILPSLHVEVHELAEERHRVVVEDNGPGIVKGQIPKVFGKLLYGSKFHRLRQSRGQQGIGVSAAGMYGRLTTGQPVKITSKIGKGRPAHYFEIVIDTAKNVPLVLKDEPVPWDKDHGTRVEIELQGTYKGGRRSVDEYLEMVAIANPHAEITYLPPKGKARVRYARATDELPREPDEIKPHPYGVELGALQRVLQETKGRTLRSALQAEFSRVSGKVADLIIAAAEVEGAMRPRDLTHQQVERLHQAIPRVKIHAPPTSCVVPIGEDLIRKGLEREIKADLYVSSTRPPAVYRGNPFQVEVGLAYGGELLGREDADDEDANLADKAEGQFGPITLLRFANRVPLQYQQSACAIFRSVVETRWRQYGLSHPRGGLPQGPMVLIVHIASVWVPFTSESKEAVAHYPEIVKEIKLGLRDCGRKLSIFLHKREHERNEARRRSIFEMYIGELVEALHRLTRSDRRRLQKKLEELARRHTGVADDDPVVPAAGAGRPPSEPRPEDDDREE